MAPRNTPTKDKATDDNTRAQTAAANAAIDFDFDNTLGEDDFGRSVGPGPWQRKLDALFQAQEDGKLGYGKYVRIGQFKSASGANTAKNGITRHPTRLIRGSFEFKTRVVRKGEDKSSELWAAVVPDDEPGEGETATAE